MFYYGASEQQGKGIGQTMMRRAIGILSRGYPYVTLAVTVGSPASGLYHRMGFASAPTVHTLSYTRS